MLKSVASREYLDLSPRFLASVVAALIYFINPFDMLHDYIPFAGLIDDGIVLKFVFEQFQAEIRKFESFTLTKNS